MYGLSQLTPPSSEPVSQAEALSYLRLAAGVDDAQVADQVVKARSYIEEVSGRQLVTSTWLMTLPAFPNYLRPSDGFGYPTTQLAFGWASVIRLAKPPLQSVTSVQYYDQNNTLQTLDPSIYDVDPTSDPGVVSLSQSQLWPITRIRPAAVQITYVAGYGDATLVPPLFKQAIQLLLSAWYEQRDGAYPAAQAAVDRLLLAGWNGNPGNR